MKPVYTMPLYMKSNLERIKEYFSKCPLVDTKAPIYLEHIGVKARSYSIMPVSESKSIPDPLGRRRITIAFDFIRKEFISDRKSKFDNIRFSELFQAWVYYQNVLKDFPVIESGGTGIKLIISASVYMTNADEAQKTGLYVTPMKFVYLSGTQH